MNWPFILLGILFSPVLIITDIMFFKYVPGDEVPGIPWFITDTSYNKRCHFGVVDVSGCVILGPDWPQCEKRVDLFCDTLYPDNSWRK